MPLNFPIAGDVGDDDIDVVGTILALGSADDGIAASNSLFLEFFNIFPLFRLLLHKLLQPPLLGPEVAFPEALQIPMCSETGASPC